MRLTKNTQQYTSKVLRLPRKMTMDTSKVLRLPRKLQHIFWKRRKSIAPATQNDFQHVAKHVWMSQSATPATRNEATTRLKPPKMTTSAKLPIGTAIWSSYERLRTVANGCERLRTVANGCERLRTVANGSATSSEHTLNPQTPRVKWEPLLRIRERYLDISWLPFVTLVAVVHYPTSPWHWSFAPLLSYNRWTATFAAVVFPSGFWINKLTKLWSVLHLCANSWSVRHVCRSLLHFPASQTRSPKSSCGHGHGKVSLRSESEIIRIHFVLLCFTLFYETRANVVLVRTCSICLRPHTVRHHVAPCGTMWHHVAPCSTTGTTAIYSRMKLMKTHENVSNPKPSEPWKSKRHLSCFQCLSSKHCEWSVTGIHQLTMGCASPWQSSKPWVTNCHCYG